MNAPPGEELPPPPGPGEPLLAARAPERVEPGGRPEEREKPAEPHPAEPGDVRGRPHRSVRRSSGTSARSKHKHMTRRRWRLLQASSKESGSVTTRIGS